MLSDIDPKEEEKKPEGEEEEAEAAAEGEEKKPTWKHTDYRWSVTNGRPHNLP